jgi:lon-related putative ATP-dependent protease
MLEEEAASRPVPSDWIYVHDFDNPDKPRAIAMPPGTAPSLKKAMEALVDDLATDIPALFDSEEYQNRRRTIEQRFATRNETAFEKMGEKAMSRGVTILRTPMGFTIAATKGDEVIKPDDFAKLTKAERDEIEEKVAETQKDLEKYLKSVPKMEKEHRKAVAELNAEMAEEAVRDGLDPVVQAFASIVALADYFAALRSDLIQNAELFLQQGSSEGRGPFPVAQTKFHTNPSFHRYGINVMVSNGTDGTGHGAPVISEPLPTLANLTGRVEHISTMGTLVTDFTLIKPGALHRANGGFLILDAVRVLTEPFAWEALKRCLEMRAIQIISAAEILSLMATTSLEPQPIPLEVRVVLVGDPILHLLLVALDPDFGRLFKIGADFSHDMARNPSSIAQFARMVATVVASDNLRAVSRGGVAALVDAATRLAEDQQKLSLQIGTLWDTLREADFLAGKAGQQIISADHVEAARTAAERRRDRVRERMQEMYARGMILVSTKGSEIGQINGLTVATIGSFSFGMPVRITARVRMGTGRVIDIEREVKMGGPIHSKGVLILSSYLSTHYAPDVPLSLWASLVFEQTYSGVEGDSSSVAELCALLSALAGVPLSQSLAVTGSINQMGEVQPIGGVNEKIEGFFDVCKAHGFTGQQGVLIPRQNAKDLMLRTDIVAAVRDGQFHVHAVSDIDEAMELLTGLPAGVRVSTGEFEDGTVNGNVEVRLLEFAAALRDFNKPRDDPEDASPEGE